MGVGDLERDLERDLLGDMDMPLGVGVGGLGGRIIPLFGPMDPFPTELPTMSQCVAHAMLQQAGSPGVQEISSLSLGSGGG